MINIICTFSKYFMIVLVALYTYKCFSVFGYYEIERKNKILLSQNIIMYLFQATAYMVMYLQTEDFQYVIFYGAQFILISAILIFYIMIYPTVSRLVLNNMCMLLSIGFLIVGRLSYDKGIRQMMICAGSMVLSLFVPVIIRKASFLKKPEWRYAYAAVGIIALLFVLVIGQTSYGAQLSFTIAGVSIQPSEFVKIVFVFFVANSFYRSTEFKEVVITTALAAAHVLVLVASTDLGAAVILYVVYLVMLYVATRNKFYLFSGILAGSVASVVAYHLFSHVRVRVEAFLDPFSVYDSGGYQVAQSLFAIGTGGWDGMGLYQGAPDTIPVAIEDFIFSAISEELGLIVGLCLILICVSCYVMFLNIAMQMEDKFYKYIALGLGTCYIFQVFLTIGGVTKFIPSTGVTLPLISYGGSSLMSTLIMFAIIQGLYILREDEEEEIERIRRQQQLRREREATRADAKRGSKKVPRKEKTKNSR